MAEHVYVGMTGNIYSSGHDVVYKIDAASRTVIGSGDTSYGGAVSKIGLLSQDKAGLYISITNGVGAGYAAMDADVPFAVGAFSGHPHWVFNVAWVPTTQARVFTGYGAFLQVVGGINTTISTTGLIDGTQLQNTRLAHRSGTAHVFVLNVGSAGVIRVNTATGAVDQVVPAGSGDLGRALYYSRDTDRVYIESAPAGPGAWTVRAYNAETLTYIAEFAGAAISDAHALGNSIYLGNETWVASESTSLPAGRIWRASMAGSGSATLFGSGCYMARDSSTGYIWTPWRTGGGTVRPMGGSVDLSGSYALVYDPAAMTLVDAIALGSSGPDFMSILMTPLESESSVYPVMLPGPKQWEQQRNERRALRSLREPPNAAKLRSRELCVLANVEWSYTAAEMDVWSAWRTGPGGISRHGWWRAALPGPGGMLPRTARFAGEPKRKHLVNGKWSVTAQVWVRYAGVAPELDVTPTTAA